MQSNINAMTKTGLDHFLTNVIKNDHLIGIVEDEIIIPFGMKSTRTRGRNGKTDGAPR